jgi:hypothetical protein
VKKLGTELNLTKGWELAKLGGALEARIVGWMDDLELYY